MRFDPGTGLERIQREAFLILYNNVNDEITLLESAWATLDQEFATAIGEDYEALELEPIEDINFHAGHRPSLIEAPISRYPNVSVMADTAGPAPSDTLDQVMSYRVRLAIEIMVKSPTFDENDADKKQMAEATVNRRIQRTTDAVNNVILMNRTLNGFVDQIGMTPNVALSDVFLRREQTALGPHWLWQGSRLEYDITKAALFDESPERPGMRSMAHGGQLNIDQG